MCISVIQIMNYTAVLVNVKQKEQENGGLETEDAL